MTSSNQALEPNADSARARTDGREGSTRMSSTQTSATGRFHAQIAPRPAHHRRGRSATALLPLALIALAALILLTRQPTLAVALIVSSIVLAVVGLVRNGADDATDAVILVGRGPMAAIIASTIEARAGSKRHAPILRATTLAETASLVRDARCDEVIVAGPSHPLYRELVDARGHRPAVISGAEKIETLLGRIPVELASQDAWLARLGTTHSLDPAIARAKRTFDLVFSFAVGLTILPVFPLIALAIKLDSRGPVFYSQERIGLGGRRFRIYKFRTMRQDAEANGAVWAQERDPRVTRVGRVMRLTRLDELPQLWNVLRGEMAVVGPRPERPEFTEMLAREIPGYDLRHTVKPGLTGWAQVCYRYASSVRDTRAKVEYDLYYVKHCSLVMDAKILLKTVKVVLGRQGQ